MARERGPSSNLGAGIGIGTHPLTHENAEEPRCRPRRRCGRHSKVRRPGGSTRAHAGGKNRGPLRQPPARQAAMICGQRRACDPAKTVSLRGVVSLASLGGGCPPPRTETQKTFARPRRGFLRTTRSALWICQSFPPGPHPCGAPPRSSAGESGPSPRPRAQPSAVVIQ